MENLYADAVALIEALDCAPCHFGQFWGTQIYNSFGEWLDSSYSDPETGRTCQDCHMKKGHLFPGGRDLETVKEGLGFDVQVEPVFKTFTIYWLDYQLADGVSIPESIFDKYTKNTKKDKVSRLQRECAG